MRRFERMKKVIMGLCCLLFCCSIQVQAAKNTQCTVYSGSNVDKQNYTYNRWSRPIYSYLEAQENGGLMRFQANASSDSYLIEYYDKEYNLSGTQLVEQELPLFGAFYATDDNYYLLTGQSNPEESDSAEVYRITKYDKDWKKISSCGLFGANTYIPFDAGSARITDAGKYLLIRTCHEMYKSSDGYHHQANVTIQVDTQTMKVTDSFTQVANVGVGYVSHSFNQFIKVENNKIVAVDHGDAYPRAIVLVKSNNEITNGTFQGSCTHSELLSIPGSTGDNTTGVTIGGFEISDSAYLVVGTQDLVQGKPSTGCNIYVFTQNKKTGTITQKKITNYTQETTSGKAAMTPQLVSLGNDQYLLLWSKENVTNYVKLDGDGNTISEQYSMQGNLSDCVPVVNGNKVIWYTWSNEKIQFYEINKSDISKNNTVSISNGHQYEYGTVDENCVVTKACKACKKELKVNIPKSFSVYWRKGWNLYVAPSERYDKDSKVLYQTGYTYADAAASNGYEKEAAYIVESSNETVATVDKQEEAVTTKEAGITTLSFYLEYNPTVKKQFIIRVGEDGQFDINDCDITLSNTSYEYDGRAHKPGVTVTYQGNTLVSGKDYELQYSDNTKVGTGKVTINGLGIFGQSVTKEFAITAGFSDATTDDDKKTPTGTPPATELPTNGIKNPNSQTDTKNDAISGNTVDDIENITFPLEEGSRITLANTIYEVVSDDEDAPTVCLLEDRSKTKKISIPATIHWNGIEYQVIKIGDYAFAGNKNLTSVVIGKNIEIIGKAAFMNCKNLKTVSLGISLNTIEKKAFYNCKKLSRLNIYSSDIRKIGKKAFSKTSKKLTVKIPANKKRTYKKLLRKAGLR